MSETEKEVKTEETEETQYSEVEQEALEHGWNPDGVEGKRNLSAEEFMDRQKLYDSIRVMKDRNRRLEEKFNALEQHYKHVSAKEREKIMKELKTAKANALENQDYESVVELDEKIADARKEPEEVNQTSHQQVFAEWESQNGWYKADSELREYADMIGAGYYNKHPDAPLEDVYAFVTKEVKERFADKFSTPKEKATMVASAQKGRSVSTSKYSVKDLPDEHKHIMKTLVRNGVLTEEKYLKEYFG